MTPETEKALADTCATQTCLARPPEVDGDCAGCVRWRFFLAGAAHEREECAGVVHAKADDASLRSEAFGSAGDGEAAFTVLAVSAGLRAAEEAIRARGKA